MGPEIVGQSCIDEILTVYTLHLDRMEELENNFLQLDIWAKAFPDRATTAAMLGN